MLLTSYSHYGNIHSNYSEECAPANPYFRGETGENPMEPGFDACYVPSKPYTTASVLCTFKSRGWLTRSANMPSPVHRSASRRPSSPRMPETAGGLLHG